MVQKKNSSEFDETMFNNVAPTYQEALNKSGYNYKLSYMPQQSNNGPKNEIGE